MTPQEKVGTALFLISTISVFVAAAALRPDLISWTWGGI